MPPNISSPSARQDSGIGTPGYGSFFEGFDVTHLEDTAETMSP